MPVDDAGRRARRSWRLPAAIALVLLVCVTYAIAISTFTAGDRHHITSDPAPNEIDVFGRLLEIHADQHEMIVRLQFAPQGKYQDEGRLTEQLDFLALTAKGDVRQSFAENEPMRAIDVTFSLRGGEVTSYPFDRYDGQVYFYLRTTSQHPTLVPVRLDLAYGIHGYSIGIHDNERHQTYQVPEGKQRPVGVHETQNLAVRIQRAGTTIVFAVFVMIVVVALALAAVVMAFVLTSRRRDIGPAAFGFLAMLLFAFPAMRDVLPGAPPIGSLNDYLSFFWAEAIIAATLVVMIAMWLTREHRALPD
jgi:hypothetical protein